MSTRPPIWRMGNEPAPITPKPKPRPRTSGAPTGTAVLPTPPPPDVAPASDNVGNRMPLEELAQTKGKLAGIIKTLKLPEGFGFLTGFETGEDFFFHRTAVIGTPWDDLHPDLYVLFRSVESPKGPRAVDVEVVE